MGRPGRGELLAGRRDLGAAAAALLRAWPGQLVADPATIVSGLQCTSYSRADGYIPALCPWYGTPPAPGAFVVDLKSTGVALAGAAVPLAQMQDEDPPDLL